MKTHAFILYAKKYAPAKGLKMMQSIAFSSIVKNLSKHGRIPKDDEFIIIYEGTQEECLKWEAEFLEHKTVGVQQDIISNINKSRTTPRFLKNKFKKIFEEHGDKLDTFMLYYLGALSIVLTTHIMENGTNEELMKKVKEKVNAK